MARKPKTKPKRKAKAKKARPVLRPLTSDERKQQIDRIRSLNPEELNEELKKTGILSMHTVQNALLTGHADPALISAAALGAKMGGIIIDKQEVKNVNSPLERMSDTDIRQLLAAKRAKVKAP